MVKLGAQVIRLNPDVNFPLPKYGTDGSAALDLYANIEHDEVLFAGENKKIPTGLKLWHGNPEYAGVILPRSSGGSGGMNLKNLVGLIDSDYQGELIVNVWNNNEVGSITIPSWKRGVAFAQITFVRVAQLVMEEVKEFSEETLRGTGGFGSTDGVKIVEVGNPKIPANMRDVIWADYELGMGTK
jgi:dUTP pyrophosphatase